MIFFKNITPSDSPFYCARVEKIHLANPRLVSRKALRQSAQRQVDSEFKDFSSLRTFVFRQRPSQLRAFAEYEDVATSHAFVLRPGNKGVIRFEVPVELKEVWDEALKNAHGSEQLHPYGEELYCEIFLLLYHEGEGDRVDALLLVPASLLSQELLSGKMDIVSALKDIADDPAIPSPLVLKNFRAWHDLSAVKVDRGHQGYPYIELPETLFRSKYPFGELCVSLWYDVDSCSILLLRNSAIDAKENMNLFGSSLDFAWEGLGDYQSIWMDKKTRGDLKKLPDIPDLWRHRKLLMY